MFQLRQILLNVESDLYHHLDTKKNLDFPHLLITQFGRGLRSSSAVILSVFLVIFQVSLGDLELLTVPSLY